MYEEFSLSLRLNVHENVFAVWFNFVVSLEMLLFSVLATVLLRPGKTALINRDTWQNNNGNNDDMPQAIAVRGGDVQMRQLASSHHGPKPPTAL